VQQVEWIAKAAPDGVVGIHLGGDEAAYPARQFVDAFRIARQAGLGVAAHAGEGDGAASVRDAIEQLGVQRVGHGVRAVEDPGLVREIASRGVTLEVCPTSNQRTGVVPDIEQHPLRRFLEAGVRVTIGSDDPSYFDTDTTRELCLVHQVLGIDLDGLDALIDNGLRASFQGEVERERLLVAFAAERLRLRAAGAGADLRLPTTDGGSD
jgi:adenosine deaminase